MRILVVEDHDKVAQFIRKGLQEQGYAVDVVGRGEDVLSMTQMNPYDLVVLDVMLPGQDGISVAKDLRKYGETVPILMLTAKGQVDDRVAGLDAGADASFQMIAVARKKVKSLPCRFDLGVAEKLPYPDGTFDGLTSTFFFHHLNLEDKLTALEEAVRVLKPGGRCVIVDVDVPTNLFGKIQAFSGYWLFDQPEIRENIDGKLVPLFAKAGFDDVQRRAHNLGYVTTFSMNKPITKGDAQ